MTPQTREITVADKVYRIGKLDVMTQWHLTRRLAPILATAGVSLAALSSNGDKELTAEDFVTLAAPIAHIVAKMTDEESDYIMYTCLAAVERREGAGDAAAWMKVVVGQPKVLGFNDIDMAALIRLVVEVLKHNLQNFMQELGGRLNSPGS